MSDIAMTVNIETTPTAPIFITMHIVRGKLINQNRNVEMHLHLKV